MGPAAAWRKRLHYTMRILAALLAVFVHSGVLAAGTKVPSSALHYKARLSPEAPTHLALTAGPLLLADEPAQRWLRQNQPEHYPRLMARAMEASDLNAVFNAHDDPRRLRQTLMVRMGYGVSVQKVLEIVERMPQLAAVRPRFEEAMLEWSALPPAIQANLGEGQRQQWPAYSLGDRAGLVYEAAMPLWRRALEDVDGDASRIAALDVALTGVNLVLNDR